MTLVMIGKGILLEGPSKIEVIWAIGICHKNKGWLESIWKAKLATPENSISHDAAISKMKCRVMTWEMVNGETPHKLRTLKICRQLFLYDLYIYIYTSELFSHIQESHSGVHIQETDFAGIPCCTPDRSIYPCWPLPLAVMSWPHVVFVSFPPRVQLQCWSSSRCGSGGTGGSIAGGEEPAGGNDGFGQSRLV